MAMTKTPAYQVATTSTSIKSFVAQGSGKFFKTNLFGSFQEDRFFNNAGRFFYFYFKVRFPKISPTN
jgi:hypothetical protein